MNLKKYISVFLVFFLLISSIPEYAVLAYSESKNKEILKANEATNSPTENLKEITNKRTPYTKTFKDEKGDFYKEIYAEPIHSKQGKEYGEIDDTLIPENEIISTENTDLKANFPKRIKDDQSIIYKKDGHRIEFEITSASQKGKGITPNLASKTDLEDNKVQYNDIYPKVDLRHITFNDEVKEDWIVNEYTGIHQFVYTLKTDLKPMSQKDGSIVFFSKEDISNAVFTLPKPMMMDSNISEQKGEGVYSDQLKYILKRVKDDTYTLTLDADDEWLKSEKRVYPVYIDPSVSIDALGDTYISSKYPKSNFNKEWDPAQGEYILKTGYYDSSTGTNYSFIKFSVVGDLKGATIESADLQAFVTHAYYAGKKNGLWVDEVKGAWGANDLTWNNKPSSTKITSTSVGRDEWAHFNVKDTIQAWVSGERSNYGFKFHTNGNGQTYWKKITAAESAKKAKIVVKYHYDQMPAPTVTATADNVTAKTGSVNVKWKSVYGATSYKLQMYDGARYETVYTGSALNWTSKGRKIFPKAPYNSNSRYSLDGKGTELPYDPSKFYSATLGSSTTTNLYKFRVVPVYPTGDGPVSNIVSKAIPIPAGEPDIPTVTTGTYGETDTANSGRGWLNIKWNKVANATGYKVRIWNGSSYKNYSVGKDTTSISTKGKKLWPTDTQIKAGIKDLQDVSLEGNSVGKGAELPIDPSKTYGNSSTRYSVRVIATSAAGDSPSSDVNYGYMKLYAPKNVKITANEDNLVQNKTSLTFDWKASTGARYYEIQLNDGKTTEKFKVKGNTTYTTKKANYALNKKYTATVTAFFEDDDTAPDTEENKISGQRGLSDKSSVATLQPNLHEELIGLEDYFTYDESEFGNTSSYVNVTTGNMSLQFTDESLYTRSDLDYNFIRTYNSRSEKVSALGKGWTFAGNESLTRTGNGDILYEDEDGTVHTFKMKTEDTFISPKGRYEKLKKQNDIYTLTSKDGFVKTYKLSQTKDTYVLVSYTDSYNNKIDFKRNEKGQIIEIEEIKAASNHENIRISYTNDKISKVQYGDYWITYDYMAESLVKTTKGNVKTNRTITENFVYDTNGQLIKYTDGKKNDTTFKYSENELVIFDKQAEDSELSVTKTYQFNQKENEYTVIDTNDNKTVYKRDEENQSFLVSQKNASGEDGQNNQTIYKIDKQYNVTEIVNPDGSTETNKYDDNGNLLISKNKEGTLTNTYNSHNQLTRSVAANGEETLYEYEGPSLINLKVNDEETKYVYDSYGRVIKTTYANNTFEKVDYDDEARQVNSTDKKGNTTSIVYSIYGQKLKEIDADGHLKSYTYDPIYAETITSIIDGNGNKTAYQYDNNNNLTTLTDALNRKKTYSYNDNDQVTTVTMPKMKFLYEYDQDGKMSKSILPSGISTDYTYKNDGQLSQIERGNETISYQYDEKGNMTKILRNGNAIKTMGYTEETNLLSTYNTKLFSQKYSYDSQERITKRLTASSQGLSVLQNTSYKENSDDIDHIQYAVGEEVLHGYQTDIDVTKNQSTFNLNNGLLKQVMQMNDANLLNSLTYTSKVQQPFEIHYNYTKNGNISKETINGQVSEYVYDANDQLTKEILPNKTINIYEYDPVGNRVKSNINGKELSFTYNDANQIIKKNDTAYKYDTDGNLLQDENYQYTYNKQQRLTKIETFEGKEVASYTYDENGLRLTKTVGDITHEYFYNNEVLDMEIVKKNSEIIQNRYYEWNGSIPLGMIVKTEVDTGDFETKAYQFITNHRGDVLSIRDSKDREVGSYQYDAYGNVLSVEGAVAKGNSIRYAGYYYDEETKNYYLQARYYNPENGSFLALDPLPGDHDDPLSQNGYNYVKNNPIMFVDPNGEAWKNHWYNSRNFLVKAINAVIFISLAAVTGWGSALLIKAGKRKIIASAKYIFAKDLKKRLRRIGVSYVVAGYISGTISWILNLAGFFYEPGKYIFNYLDSRDKKRNNGYFNGF